MDVKIKRLHDNAVLPKYAKDGDAGIDLTAIKSVKSRDHVTYHTGLAIEIPRGYVGLLFPRSSVYKADLQLSNSVGVIDSGYRGEITFKFKYINGGKILYSAGDRVGQLIIMPYPQINLIEVTELSDSDRGEGGYGSTGV